MTWLGDSVFSIREAATNNVKKLTEVFGVDWAKTNLIPKVLALHVHPNYLYRMTTLFAISVLSSSLVFANAKQALAPIVGAELLTSVMLPLVIKLSRDTVPNIRFNVAKTLHHLIPLLDNNTVQSQVRPCLQKLNEDTDKDVKYFADQALKSC